jgi:hypothetical protein
MSHRGKSYGLGHQLTVTDWPPRLDGLGTVPGSDRRGALEKGLG